VKAVPGTYLARAPRDHVDGAVVRGRPLVRLLVGAVDHGVAGPAVHDVLGTEGPGQAVVTVDEVAPLVGVAVTREHQVDPEVLEDRQRELSNLDLVQLDVRVVEDALAVRGLVPERDQPVGIRGGEVGFEPGEHGRPRGRVHDRVLGVEDDEVDVAVVERVVGLGSGRHAPRFTVGRKREDVEVGPGLRQAIGREALVVPEAAPRGHGPEELRVLPEDGGLVLGVARDGVGVVPEHEPDVRRRDPAVERGVGVADGVAVPDPAGRDDGGIGKSRIPDRPDASRLGRTGRR
jgi:hypothetical protein